MKFPISTKIDSHCTDCYRCLRKCPIDAISFSSGRAQIIQKKCVLCGECIAECPQRTKYVVSDYEKVRQNLLSGVPMVLSVGETVVNHFPNEHPYNILCQCMQLGFKYVEQADVVEETMLDWVADYLRNKNEFVISSHCPVVVNLVEQHYPHLIEHLMQIPTLPAVHAAYLKQTFPNDKVVHVTSCIAEMNNERTRSHVDYLITFKELEKIFKEKEAIPLCNENLDVSEDKGGFAFSIVGNVVKKMIAYDVEEEENTEHFSGLRNCIRILDSIGKEGTPPVSFLELMACDSGCVSGHDLKQKGSVMDRCLMMKQYEDERKNFPAVKAPDKIEPIPFRERRYIKPAVSRVDVMKEMQSFFNQKGMRTLNCAACGFDTCYKKSEAVVRGEADRTMCMSYMRMNAESFAGDIVRSSANGLIVFNNKFEILQLNPTIQSLLSEFHIKEGTKLSDYMDIKFMKPVVNQGVSIRNHMLKLDDLNLYLDVSVLPMENMTDTFLAVFQDVTEHETRKTELEAVKRDLLVNAEKVIDDQMRSAQQIANLLGETTAATKITLLELIREFEK